MNAITALQRLREQGIDVLPEGETIRIIPKIPEGMCGELVRLKPEIVPMVRILAALESGPMKHAEIMQETGIDLSEVYHALGALYGAGLVKTDPAGWYYLPAQYTRPSVEDMCLHCRDTEARGTRVLACSVCDRRVN